MLHLSTSCSIPMLIEPQNVVIDLRAQNEKFEAENAKLGA